MALPSSPRTQTWEVRNFGGGLNTVVDDSRLATGNRKQGAESPDLDNVVFDPGGTLKRRKGFTQYGSGNVGGGEPEFLGWWAEDHFVTVNGDGDVHVWNADAPALAAATLLTPGEEHGGYAFNGLFYIHNQTDGGYRISATPNATSVAGHPAAKHSAVLRDRVFVANLKESGLNLFSRVRFSELADAETWDQNDDNDFIDVVPDDLEEITGLEVVADRLAIFKENSIYLLSGHTRDSFTIVPISVQRGGCPFPDTIVRADDGIYFFSNDGVKRFTGKSIEHLSARVDPISGTPISATYANQQYFLLVDDNGTKRIYVYDTVHEWWTRWSAIPVKTLVTDYRSDETERRVYGLSDSAGKLFRLEDGDTDDGESIDAYWESGWLDLGMPEVRKRTRRIYITSAHDSDPVALEIYKDWDPTFPYKTILTRFPEGDHQLRKTAAVGMARAIKHRLENTNGGQMQISSLTVTFVPRRLR